MTVARMLPAVLLFSIVGCASNKTCCPTDIVRPEVYERVATYVSPVSYTTDDEPILSGTAVSDDMLSEDALVQLALENNKLFRAALSQLGIAQGDWIQASLLTNPSLANFFPVGVKQWEWTLYLPIETFLLRPHREAVAHSDYHRVASGLVQNGLTLVRDVRVAYANHALAVQQLKLAREAFELREQIHHLTQKRLSSGDIGELESIQARIDAMSARANLAILKQNIDVARNRIHNLIGVPNNEQAISSVLELADAPIGLDSTLLVEHALVTRPDMRAACWAVDAISRRSRLSRWQFWRVDGVIDANAKGQNGYEVGPGIRLDIPIFNRNEGGIMRADAEVCQAIHNRDATREQIIEEVRTATSQLQQTQAGLAILNVEVVPAIAETISIARKGYEDGGIDYLSVLQATTQYLDVRTRVLDQTAAMRRAVAELERSIAGPAEHFTTASPTEATIEMEESESDSIEQDSDVLTTE